MNMSNIGNTRQKQIEDRQAYSKLMNQNIVRVRMTASPWGLPAGEFGWDGAAGTYLMVDPVNRISVVIGMHIRHWIYCFRHEHLNLVKEIYLGL